MQWCHCTHTTSDFLPDRGRCRSVADSYADAMPRWNTYLSRAERATRQHDGEVGKGARVIGWKGDSGASLEQTKKESRGGEETMRLRVGKKNGLSEREREKKKKEEKKRGLVRLEVWFSCYSGRRRLAPNNMGIYFSARFFSLARVTLNSLPHTCFRPVKR